jgi:hypothetical protein
MAGTHRSGRKRKPTAIKVLEGSYRKDRHGHEMQVLTGWPEPPVWMNDRERGIWDGLRPYCQAWITESDWPALYGLVSTMEMILLNREARAANEGKPGSRWLTRSRWMVTAHQSWSRRKTRCSPSI